MVYDPAKFRDGESVQIADRGFLEEFLRSSNLSYKLQTGSTDHAGQIAKIRWSGMYHGGYVLYELDGIPGVWREEYLRDLQVKSPHP